MPIIGDTEYTTFPGALESGWSGPGQHREIVQIAAIRTDALFRETASLDIIVRPRINPVLDPLFVQLTDITQQRVDEEGLSFEKAQQQYLEFCRDEPVACMNGDESVFRENCRLTGVPFPFAASWHRFWPLLDQLGVDPECSSGTLHLLTDAPMEGHVHNALHDVRSMACWMRFAVRTGLVSGIDDLPTGAPAFDRRSSLSTAT